MAHKLSSIRMDGCRQIAFPELSRQIDIGRYAYDTLSLLDNHTLYELHNATGGTAIRFNLKKLDGAVRFPFELSDFYIRQTTIKSLLAGTSSLLIRAGGDVRAETLLTNKIGSTDKITLRSMDGNKMRNLDAN